MFIEIYWGYFIFPIAAVALALLVMLTLLIRSAIRRARCPHTDVRRVRQQRGDALYFVEICMHCQHVPRVRL